MHGKDAERFFDAVLRADIVHGVRQEGRVGLLASRDARLAARPLFSQTLVSFSDCVARNIRSIEPFGSREDFETYVAHIAAIIMLWQTRLAEFTAHPARLAHMPAPHQAGPRFMVFIVLLHRQEPWDIVDLFP